MSPGPGPEAVAASAIVDAPADAVFAVLADPSAHADVDGTGWVRGELDVGRITAAGQVFRMAMFHPDHPDGDYEIHNLVTVYDEPWAIAWKPGTASPETGELSFGGWIWRYDLAPEEAGTRVVLTYDWSAVGPEVRTYLDFPPFPPDHLASSLRHLAELVRRRTR